MKKFLVALALLGTFITANADIVTVPIPGAPGLSVTVGTGVNALPLQNIHNNPNAVNITTWDDAYTEVPLGFNFPFFGRTFDRSWAMTNGMVTFQDPATTIGGACCSGVDLSRTTDTRWNYSIFGLHTDLYSWNGQNQYYLRGTNEMTYGWYNISQCCSSQGGNSFEIKINSAGVVDTRIAGAMVQWNAVTSGMSGDLSKGEYFQYYHGQGINIPMGSGVSWNTAGGFTGSDPCITNPLSSSTCPGYAVAYLNQQCTISALYNPSCPGYATAYFTQQCTTNSMYNESCPGYADAYLIQQCSLNPLYSSRCSGYQQAYYDQQCTANPLYDTNCPGYASAYLNQQCNQNPLYSTQCAGYEAAYLTQQCNQNPLYSTQCSGYQQAYFNQQCTANPLYNRSCPGYDAAYLTQQCTLNQLYSSSCPGYQQAYFDQQCSLNGLYSQQCTNYATAYFDQQCRLNGLYDKKCPNYATAYATTQALQQTSTVNTSTSVVAAVAIVDTTPSVDSSGDVKVAVVADKNVNEILQTSATSASPAQAATATVPLVTNPAPAAAATTKAETNASSSNVSSVSTTQTTNSAEGKSEGGKPTARQEMQERRQAAAKAAAVEQGKQLANKMGEVSSMEAQVQVQNVVVQAMGFTPGFDAYGKVTVPDAAGYKPYSVYNNQKTIDNRRVGLGLFGPTDTVHNDMVNSQFNLGK